MNTMTPTQVRFFASATSWIEGEAVRQLYATSKLDGVRCAVGFPDLHPGRGSPVGAGRKWARSDARQRMRERFSVSELAQTPLDSRVICEERDLLYEEAPAAYKNIEAVVQDLVAAGLVSVVATLRPLLTYKMRKQKR